MEKQSHLSLETLARWLSGRLEHEELLATVVPHLLAHCSDCRGVYGELQRLKQEVGHWDEEVAVFETQRAPEQLESLVEVPFEQQLRLIGENDELHTWGLCQLLLAKSRKALFSEPVVAVDLASLAVSISAHLGDAYDPNWVLDLRARAFADLGNARRVLGELRAAEDDFRQAEACFAQSTTGNVLVEAEIADLKSSLRLDQRRLPEALEIADRALGLYREAGAQSGIGKVLLQKAKIIEETGDLETAISLLEALPKELDREQEPRLFRYSRHNLLGLLTLAGRYGEAQFLLAEVRELLQGSAQPLDQVRLRWVEGSIALGLGRYEEAEAALREVQLEFLQRQMGYNAALVSLDLGVLYAQQGRGEDLKRLATELLPVFESRDVHREALVVLLMFQHACEEERLTVELARQLSWFLRRERGAKGCA